MGQILPRSKINWKDLERLTSEEQKEFLSKWEKKFKDEAVSSTDRNVKKGDHLVIERYFGYTHHLICIEKQGDHIRAMEYGLPIEESSAEVLLDLENLGKVHEKTFTFEQLENMTVKKRVWPKELRRYNANKSVEKAESRKGEKKYKCLTNNCEHFVMWCICGLSVSLQVKSWYTWAKEVLKFLCFTTRECVMCLVLLLIPHPNLSPDEISFKILSQPENAAFVFGFAFVLVVQMLLCLYEVGKAIADRKSQDIQTDHELDATIVEIIAKKWFQFSLGAAGFVFCLPYNFLGKLVGALVGVLVGNRLGVIANCYVKTDLGLAGFINPVHWLYLSLTVIHTSMVSVSGCS